MQKLVEDFKNLVVSHVKTILVIALALYLVYSYPDIKQGVMDGWMAGSGARK
jgi:hypothetical protein